MASKLAAAYVSQGTYASESAASNLVETVAVRAFVDGLKDPTTQFLLKARNPTTLNKAISDALECGPGLQKTNEMTLWFNNSNRGYYRGCGYQRGRGNSRGNYCSISFLFIAHPSIHIHIHETNIYAYINYFTTQSADTIIFHTLPKNCII